jgi:hypothetical protein
MRVAVGGRMVGALVGLLTRDKIPLFELQADRKSKANKERSADRLVKLVTRLGCAPRFFVLSG